MSIYKKISEEIVEEKYAKTLYRFEGANSICKLNQNNLFDSSYIYFSKSLEHHQYFILKRIKQMLNKCFQEELGYQISYRNLNDYSKNTAIRNLVLNTNAINNLYSYQLLIDTSLYDTIVNNSINSDIKKDKKRYIEKVDRRVRGGGYGLSNEWKELLIYLTFFTATFEISRNDILELLKNIKKSTKTNKISNLDFMFESPSRYRYSINDHIFNDFNKYNIINTLETIIENNLISPTSELSKFPSKSIKEIINSYEKGRNKILSKLDD